MRVAKNPRRPLGKKHRSDVAYEVHSDGSDVTLRESVVLQGNAQRPSLFESTPLPTTPPDSLGDAASRALTENRRSKQDLPTPESPIRTSLNK